MAKNKKNVNESIGEWVDISKLKEWDKNPRNNQNAIEEVAKSIKRFGFASPIIARKEDGTIIAGHTRFKASKLLKLEKVPVRYMDLDPADSKLLALADNKVGEIAEWNDDLLKSVLKDLKNDEIDLSDIGFSDDELNQLLDDNKIDENIDFTDDDIEYVYQIFVENLTSVTQAELLERLINEGYTCRALTV